MKNEGVRERKRGFWGLSFEGRRRNGGVEMREKEDLSIVC